MSYFKNLLIAVGLIACVSSCRTPKDIAYFQGQGNGQSIEVVSPNFLTAQPDDRLSISVHARDAQLAEIFNLPIQSRNQSSVTTGRSSSASRSSGSNQMSVYTVDNYGDIEFPELGTIHVAGLTRQEIAQMIKDELVSRKLLKDPTITVEFVDHSFTVLGAVGSPGRIIFDRDKLNLIEAIALAGDLQINGQRENVMVYRMIDGKQKAYEVNLTDPHSIYSSPAYYIQQNDVIYVEPNNLMKRNTTPLGNSTFTPAFWISLASFAMTVALLFVK
ncbi:MAG: polysaccharide biosynthesis/export family protein [Muribaculaceae bacterium]|nr:polysaccharide biosynthesis/export family protein [Muribaculaceae bacterium]